VQVASETIEKKWKCITCSKLIYADRLSAFVRLTRTHHPNLLLNPFVLTLLYNICIFTCRTGHQIFVIVAHACNRWHVEVPIAIYYLF
jgi:hypothetical protein